MTSTARRMWRLFEPVHAVTYFAPAARETYEEAGLRGFWRGYFAGRAAPLGPVGPGPVVATFFGFAPGMVARAVPDVWHRLEPTGVLRARLDGARRVLGGLPGSRPDRLAEVAGLLRAAAMEIDPAGRPLGAANADLPWPEDDLGVLWQAATVLREHRGDGHVAALLVHGLDGLESLVWRAGIDADRAVLQPARGWSDEEWAAGKERLVERGWLTPDGTATPVAVAARDEIEWTTDVLAEAPWRALGAERTDRLADLLGPITTAVAGVLRYPNPIGLDRPTGG